jgi:hypothetical protein
MTEDRTEALALRQRLRIAVGGETVELRTLSLDESDVWLGRFTSAIDIDTAGIEGDAAGLARLLTMTSDVALDLIIDYDRDGVLPTREQLRATMGRQEVKAALEAMAQAEDPFGEGASRLVDEVFGAPSRFLGNLSRLAVSDLASRMDDSPNGASTPGASTTTATSAPHGVVNGSSSSGPTATTGSTRQRKTTATRSPTV